jgi:flagellar motor switch protein FliN/FliY
MAIALPDQTSLGDSPSPKLPEMGLVASAADIILDVNVDLSLEVGRTTTNIRRLLQMNIGTIIELDRPAGEPLDVYVNGRLVAHGEVVMVNERYGVRFTDSLSQSRGRR